MRLVIDTWRGVNINDGTNYVADFPENMPLVNPSSPILVDMLDVPSQIVGRRLTGSSITIFVQPQINYRANRETLRQLFKTEEKFQFYTLAAHDEDDSDRVWTIEAAVLTATPKDDAFIIVLGTKTSYWKTTHAPDTLSYLASGDTHDFTVVAGSDHSMYPVITFEPQAQKTDGYLYEQWVMFRNTNNSSGTHPFDVGEGIDTAALILAAKMLASGYDFRVFVNNIEKPRWFGNFNSAATKVWVNLVIPNTYTVSLRTAISGVGTPASIDIKSTPLNIERFKSWPSEGTIVIDDEGFTYSAKDSTQLKVTGITRAYRGTAAAAHTIGDLVHLQSVDIKLVYGNNTAEDPEYPDDEKPTIDLDTSTNNSHVQLIFGDSTGNRKPQWTFSKGKGDSPETREYTDDHGADIDPYEVAGMQAESYNVGGVWRADTVGLRWQMTPAYRVSGFSISGEKYKSTDIGPVARVYTELAGKRTVRYLIPQPTLLATWEPWTFTVAGLGGIQIDTLFVNFVGSTGAVENAQGLVEIQDFTITYNASYVPTVKRGPELGTYDYNLLLENLTNGYSLTVKRKVRLSPGTVEIDTENHIIKVNGKKSSAGVTLADSREWFKLDPGVNQIKVTEVGLTSMDVTIEGSATRGV